MKKAIVLLLVLAVLGGAVFAEDAKPSIKFDGYVSTGVVYNATQDLMDLQNYYNSGKDTRVRFNVSLADGDFGMKFRLQANAFNVVSTTNGGDTIANVAQAYVRGGFIDNMIKFKLGKLDDYSMATSWSSFGATDGKIGAQFFLMPIAGLTFDTFMPITQAGTDIATVIEGTKLGAKYALDGVGTFLVGGYLLGDVKQVWFNYSLGLTALENLGGYVEVRVPNLDDVAPALIADISYGLDALTVGIWTNEVFADELYWYVDPYVTYALSEMLTVGADVAYDSDALLDITASMTYALSDKTELNAKVGYTSAEDVVISAAVDFYF